MESVRLDPNRRTFSRIQTDLNSNWPGRFTAHNELSFQIQLFLPRSGIWLVWGIKYGVGYGFNLKSLDAISYY